MNLFTSFEMQLLMSAATNAPRFRVQEQDDRLVYTVDGLPGMVLIHKEPLEDLEALADRVHAIHPDTAAVIAWTLTELIGDPREAQPKGKTPSASFAISRVACEALGVNVWKVSKAKREELLYRVAEGLWFARRARVECSRPGVYDMGGDHRESVKTAAALLTGQRLDLEAGSVPRVVEVSLSLAWLCPLTGSRAQYLPVGDAFAKLSSGRPAGARARSIALWLVAQCRIQKPSEGEVLRPVAPGEILDRYGVGDAMPAETHKNRMLDTWAAALRELEEAGLIAPHPDSNPEALRERLGTIAGGRGGAPLLSTQAPPLAPGPVLIDALEAFKNTGDPLKVASSPPKSGELDPENWRARRGESALNIKDKSGKGGAPEVAPPTSPPLGNRRRRPCPVCGDTAKLSRGDNPTAESRAARSRKGGAR